MNANQVTHPVPRTTQPYAISGRPRRLPRIDGGTTSSGARSDRTLHASNPAPATVAASTHSNPFVNPVDTANAPTVGPIIIPIRRSPSCQVSSCTARPSPHRSPVSASNADRPGVASASPHPSSSPLMISNSGDKIPSPAAAGTDANAIADTSATTASRGPESTHCRALRAHHGDSSTGTPAAPATSPVAATDPVSRRITSGSAT